MNPTDLKKTLAEIGINGNAANRIISAVCAAEESQPKQGSSEETLVIATAPDWKKETANKDDTLDEQRNDGNGIDELLPNQESHSVLLDSIKHQPSDEEKYERLQTLGKGGMGEVREVFDKTLNRPLAMKVIHDRLSQNPGVVARFIEEAQVVAQLQHPNIVPIHEMGVLADGSRYFTMKKVEGVSLDKLVKRVHEATEGNEWMSTRDGWSLRRLLSVFLDICEALAFAHSKSVVHRDLKPENIMIGEFGEVLVLDWGIAKIIGAITEEVSVKSTRHLHSQFQTQTGQVAGTPAYMAPEQAMGQIDKIDQRSDVYSLGAIMYEILSGLPPYSNTRGDVLNRVRTHPPEPLRASHPSEANDGTGIRNNANSGKGVTGSTHPPPIPQPLVRICERAMARERTDRYASVSDLADAVRGWLDGAQKKDQAMAVIDKASEKSELAAAHKSILKELVKEIQRLQPNGQAAIDLKRAHWQREKRRHSIEIEIERLEVEEASFYQAAFTHMPNLLAAHRGLVKLYRQWHEKAEANQDSKSVRQLEWSLRKHAEALPEEEQNPILNYLDGKGQLSVVTQSKGVRIYVETYEHNDNHLTPVSKRYIGESPIFDHDLEMGSYRLIVESDEHPSTRVPFVINRQGHTRIGSKKRPLPLLTDLYIDGQYVPEGWVPIGGDVYALNSLSKRDVWLDGFVMMTHPVTNRQYLSFLNSLLTQGRLQEAWKWSPKSNAYEHDQTLYDYVQETNSFAVSGDPDSPLHGLDWPVSYVSWLCANAYAKWFSQETGLLWRLPTELEWEKAAIGADRRTYAWGNMFDASFCCNGDATENPSPADIMEFPIDESPFGVRHMSGNMSEWTASVWYPDGVTLMNGKPTLSATHDNDLDRVVRGGYWEDHPRRLRVGSRDDATIFTRDNYLGFRLVYSS